MDFIITWVDGNDPEWQKEYYKYKEGENMSNHRARFRDWDNLQYWFRGVEKFAPWVDKIHFVTWGHLPEWLNTDHPKLNIVKHEDYMPEKYLPTFNSRAIELNFHRIKELNEEYVYFNDDMFLIDGVKKIDFFKEGKICDMALHRMLGKGSHEPTLFRNTFVLNRNFLKETAMKSQPTNWVNLRYGIKKSIRNILYLLANRSRFSGFRNFHLAQPCRKEVLRKIWETEYGELNTTCINKFRDYNTVNPYIQRNWELASNNFYPINRFKQGEWLSLDRTDFQYVLDYIRTQKKPMVCINDHVKADSSQFEEMKAQIIAAFEEILPEKSEFEK